MPSVVNDKSLFPQQGTSTVGEGQRREFIYFPSGGVDIPEQGVYADWANLLAAMAVEETPALVLVQGDGTPNPVTIPAGTWALPGRYTEFVGALGTSDVNNVVPQFGPDAGAVVQWQGILSFSALTVGSNGGRFEPVEDVSAVLLGTGSRAVSGSGGDVFVVDGNRQAFFLLADGGYLQGSVGGPYALSAGPTGFVGVLANSGTVEDNCIGGAGQAVVIQGPLADFAGNPPGTYGRTQPVAIFNWLSSAPAAVQSYDPIPADWVAPGPTDVQDAITRLVRRQVENVYFWSTIQAAPAPFFLPSSGDAPVPLTIADRSAFHIAPKAGQLRRVTVVPTLAGGPTTVNAYINGGIAGSLVGNLNAMAATTFVFPLAAVVFGPADNLSIEVVPSAAVGDVVGSTVIDFDDLGEA